MKKYWDDDFIQSKMSENKKKEGKILKKKVEYFSIVKVERSTDAVSGKRKSEQILEEAIEYIIIEKLSSHLSSYFQSYSNEDKFIKEYDRKDIPELLLNNRILNLLTTPFEDRSIFVKSGISEQKTDGKIYAIFGSDGSRYNRFDLTLPIRSRVSRPSSGQLEIDNDRVYFRIEIRNAGFTALLPNGFQQNYLGIVDKELMIRKVGIKLSYKIKPWSLFLGSKWNYHNWIDSFTENLLRFASFKIFVKDINWEAIFTNIVVNNQKEKLMSKMHIKE
ncbi:hypothetical protein [Leptospira stimsonii]|uniref:Uncharacterized protein n=1 Tax=Leptospira stimsonii TaxID=2202203 RepID=A0A8B3CVP2_9LEPT|nr:hypothetical protein [Leptospira stimsonii]RHX88719.1 hypothetical protein DLM78_07305 [Leptospira stimsonii]